MAISNQAIYTNNEINNNFSDINAINNNYLTFRKYFDDIKAIEDEQGNYVFYGFNLQSIETFVFDTNISLSGTEIFYGQIILHYTDFDVNQTVKFDNLQIYESDNKLFFLRNNILIDSCMQLIINIVINGTSTTSFVNFLLPTGAEDKVITSFNYETKAKNYDFVDLLLSDSFMSSKLRFSWFYNNTANVGNNITVHDNIRLDIIQSLNLTTTITQKAAYYAYFEMTQQQLLDSIELYSSENSLLTNVLIMNKEVFDIKSQLQYLPNFSSYLLSNYSNIFKLPIEPIYSLCKSFINSKNSYMQINYYQNLSIKNDVNFCGNNQLCNLQFKLTDRGCDQTIGNSFILTLGLNISEEILPFDITFNIEPNLTNSNLMYANIKTNDSKCGFLNFCTFYEVNEEDRMVLTPILVPAQEQVYIPTKQRQTLILNNQVTITYLFSVSLNATLSLYNPISVTRQTSQGLEYGILFDISYTQISANNLQLKSNDLGKRRDIAASLLKCNTNYLGTTNNSPNILFPFLASFNTPMVPKLIKCASNPNEISQAVTFDIVSGILEMSIEQISGVGNAIFALSSPELPNLLVSDSVSNLEYNLNLLASKVVEIDERVTNLEDVSSGFLSTLTSMLGIFSNTLDFAINIADKANYLIKLSTKSKNLLSKQSRTDSALATEFIEKINTLQKPSGYNPLEAINEATVFSYQHGLAKTNFRNLNFGKKKFETLTVNDYLSNLLDTREIIQTNPTLYLDFQRKLGDKIKFPEQMNIPNHGFGLVSVHSSPIEQIPVVNKFLHDISVDSNAARSFLSNQCQKFPFHTSGSIRNFEINKEGKVLYNIRFTGVAEPSVIGPTNAKNPRVKIGYIKLQYEVDTNLNSVKLLNWDKTKIVDDRVYTADEVRQLYLAFSNKKTTSLSTDQQWLYISSLTNNRINSRNVIDTIPLPNDIYLQSLDDLIFFSKAGNNFKYNIFSNNCQNYIKVFSQLATNGYSKLNLAASDFAEYAKIFGANANNYISNYFKRVIPYLVSYKESTVIKIKAMLSKFVMIR